MGSQQSIQKCNFEDVQKCIIHKNTGMLINTLHNDLQGCLIENTIPISQETQLINSLMKTNTKIQIIIYGLNTNDPSLTKKYEQFIELGFNNVFIYTGGLFEWLCLQDIYGGEEFPTTSHEIDILKFKPRSNLSSNLMLMD